MLNIDSFNLYSTRHNSFSLTKKGYTFFTIFDNDNFKDAFNYLNVPRKYIRRIFLPYNNKLMSRRLYSNKSDIKYFTEEKFIIRMNDPLTFDNENYYYLIDKYFNVMDTYYKGQYKNAKSKTIFNNIMVGLEEQLDKSKNTNIAIYSINRNKFNKEFFQSKLYLLNWYLMDRKKNKLSILFDMIFLHIYDKEGNVTYIKIADGDDWDIKRWKTLYNSIEIVNSYNNEMDDSTISNKVIEYINDDILKEIGKDDKKSKNKLTNLINEKLKNDESIKKIFVNELTNKELTDDQIKNNVNDIIVSLFGDRKRKYDQNSSSDKNLTEFEKKENMKTLISNSIDYDIEVKEEDIQDVTIQDKLLNPSKNIIKFNNGKKYREFRKYQVEHKLKDDLITCINTLSTKKFPFQLMGLTFSEVTENKTDIDNSNLIKANFELKDNNGKIQVISFIIPKMISDNYFELNGRKKILLNQLVPLPIYFFKPYHCRISTIYNTMTIYDKVGIKDPYYIVYVSGKKIPLIHYLFINNGIKKTNKRYKVKMSRYSSWYEYKDNHEDTHKYSLYLKFQNMVYVFDMNEEYTYHLYTGLMYNKGKLISYIDNKNILDLEDEKIWSNFINLIFDNYGTSYKIKQTHNNIIDVLSMNILKNKDYPYQIDDIIEFIVKKLIEGQTDKKNDLNNYRVRNFEVIPQLIMKDLMIAYAKYEKAKLANLEDAKLEINPWQAFTTIQTMKLIVNVENINALEELTYIDKVTFAGDIVGISTDSQDAVIRSVDDSYYGVIDAADTPEGAQGVGITQHLALGSNIKDIYGNFETKNSLNSIPDNDTLSISSSMIPFIEKSEPTRVMFATNHEKQGVPLINKQTPIIRTGYESLVGHLASDDFVKRTEYDGVVTNITSQYIEITNDMNKKIKYTIKPKILRTGTGLKSISFFEPLVKLNDKVVKGQIIANGANIKNNIFSNGNNALCAYMMWKGYTFEDGIVVSETLSKQMSTYSVIEKDYLIGSNDEIQYIFTNINEDLEKGSSIIKIKPENLVDVELYDQTQQDEITIDDESFIQNDDGINSNVDFNHGILSFDVKEPCKLISISVYGDLDKYSNVKKELFKFWDKSKTTFKKEKIEGLMIKFKLFSMVPVGLGDKVANRHGNKGVVCYVEKDENMPITPWGERIDLIFNPISVIGRTNTGQIFECYLGLISHMLKRKVLNAKTQKESNLNLILKIYKILDNTDGKKIYNAYKNSFDKMTKKEYEEYLKDLEENGLVLYAPSFRGPTSEQIEKALKLLKLDTKMQVYLPEGNVKTKYPVVVGLMYEQRLEHLSGIKSFARSTGIYRTGIGQPTQGKKSGGGLKVGEMDSWALMSYDVPHVLSELFYPMSDDHKAKNQMISNIIKDGRTDLNISMDKTDTDEIIKAYLISMGVEENTDIKEID